MKEYNNFIFTNLSILLDDYSTNGKHAFCSSACRVRNSTTCYLLNKRVNLMTFILCLYWSYGKMWLYLHTCSVYAIAFDFLVHMCN